MKTHKQKETITYDFDDGFKCYIKIDYFNNRIDIVEPIDITQSKFKKKDFTFIGRGVEYMNGWCAILEHLQEAIKDAQKKYLDNLAEESSFKAREQYEVDEVIEKELCKPKKKK